MSPGTHEALSNEIVHSKPLTNHQLMFEAFGLCENTERNAAGDYTCLETVKTFRIFMVFSNAADRELVSSRIEINTKAQLVKKLENDVEYWRAKANKTMVATEDGYAVDELTVPPVQQLCGGCDWSGSRETLRSIGGCALTAGDPSPSGRCPCCSALCYPKA